MSHPADGMIDEIKQRRKKQLDGFVRQMRRVRYYYPGWLQGLTLKADVYDQLVDSALEQNRMLGQDVMRVDGQLKFAGVPLKRGGK